LERFRKGLIARIVFPVPKGIQACWRDAKMSAGSPDSGKPPFSDPLEHGVWCDAAEFGRLAGREKTRFHMSNPIYWHSYGLSAFLSHQTH